MARQQGFGDLDGALHGYSFAPKTRLPGSLAHGRRQIVIRPLCFTREIIEDLRQRAAVSGRHAPSDLAGVPDHSGAEQQQWNECCKQTCDPVGHRSPPSPSSGHVATLDYMFTFCSDCQA
jgi:hypothetical protein